ncbi:hypothetical protein ACT8ZR_09190 [Neobacillus sp. M.A.Huq-85]
MNQEIILNNVKLSVENLVVENIQDGIENEGKELRFSFVVTGENEFNLYKNLLNNENFEITIINTEETLKVRKTSYSYNFPHEIYDDTEITIHVTLREENEDKQEPNLFANIAIESISARTRINAIIQLLIEKEMITMDEYTKKFDEIHEINKEKYKDDLFGKIEE